MGIRCTLLHTTRRSTELAQLGIDDAYDKKHWKKCYYSLTISDDNIQEGQLVLSPSSTHMHFGLVIKLEGCHCPIRRNNIVPGIPHYQCSYCSELIGLIGAVRQINLSCNLHNIMEGNVELDCDSLDAFKVASRYTFDLQHIYPILI